MKKIAFPFFTVMFLSAGIAHFLVPGVFLKAMPPIFPFPFFINILVGILEIALAISFWTKFRKIGVYAAIGLLMVFQIFVHSYHLMIGEFPGFPEVNISILWLRVFAQFGLIYWFWAVRNE